MLSVNDLSINFGGNVLFSRVDLQFTPGNCYGIIGANGAGKSTFIKILSGELEPSTGSVTIAAKKRMSVLKQNQNMYDDYTVMDTVIMGNQRLYDCGKEKDAIYDKPDFDDADGIRAAELEEEFAELGGWEAESDASRILQGLGVSPDFHETMMRDIDPRLKVKVLLAQALFGSPDIILLDEPTNNLDLASVVWLEDFLMDYEGTVLVVSHDRYFLNNVCTHIVDIDYGKIKMYVGNYDFWYESSQLMQKLIKDQNKKAEQKIAELQGFIARFSANKSKSRQATSRRKLLDKLTVEEMPASGRRYPWVGFKADREPGKDRLFVTEVSKCQLALPFVGIRVIIDCPALCHVLRLLGHRAITKVKVLQIRQHDTVRQESIQKHLPGFLLVRLIRFHFLLCVRLCRDDLHRVVQIEYQHGLITIVHGTSDDPVLIVRIPSHVAENR